MKKFLAIFLALALGLKAQNVLESVTNTAVINENSSTTLNLWGNAPAGRMAKAGFDSAGNLKTTAIFPSGTTITITADSTALSSPLGPALTHFGLDTASVTYGWHIADMTWRAGRSESPDGNPIDTGQYAFFNLSGVYGYDPGTQQYNPIGNKYDLSGIPELMTSARVRFDDNTSLGNLLVSGNNGAYEVPTTFSSGQFMKDNGIRANLTTTAVVFEPAAIGANTVIGTGVSASGVRVLAYLISASGPTTVFFQEVVSGIRRSSKGYNILSGQETCASGAYLFQTANSQGLSINSSKAVNISVEVQWISTNGFP